MIKRIDAETLQQILQGGSQYAFIDVREAGEYNSSHIPGASLIPRRQLEFSIAHAVPFTGVPVVLCDDDGRRAQLAAATLERLGYEQVSVLDGGINRWVTRGLATEWGSNVPSKDFGEKVEVVHHVPELDATELAERMHRGDKLVILDSRTPEEFRRFHPRWPECAWHRVAATHHGHHQGSRQGYDHHRQLCWPDAQH
jgi:rhodanese-related sulfurtransferase